MTIAKPTDFLTWLKAQGYKDIKIIGENKWTGIHRFIFTHAIIVGNLNDCFGYEDRWCYETYEKAKAALEAWGGKGEPENWHRHPATGRRRDDGDPLSEYINL